MLKLRQFLGFISSFLSYLTLAPAAVLAVGLEKRIDIKPEIAPTFDIADLISAIINLLFVVAAVIAIIFLIYGGIRWILSGGDKSAVETARNTIVASIVGLVIVFAAFFILSVVFTFFGIDLIRNFRIPTVTTPTLR